jgi:hypothetical protein
LGVVEMALGRLRYIQRIFARENTINDPKGPDLSSSSLWPVKV